MQVGFKDKALPAKAVLAVVSKADVMDGKVEVDRRANSPEALLAALAQKEAELEELKARYAGGGPAGLVLSEWLTEETCPFALREAAPADASGLKAQGGAGYKGASSALVAIRVRNLPGQKPWVLGQAPHWTMLAGAPVKVLSVQMKAAAAGSGRSGAGGGGDGGTALDGGKAFSVELVDASGQRRLSFNLVEQ